MEDIAWKLIEPERIKSEKLEQYILQNAPPILYTKNDKDKTSMNYLISFFFVVGFYLIFLSIWTLMEVNLGGFELSLFFIITIIVFAIALPLLLLYIRRNVYNKPIQSYYEWFIAQSDNIETIYSCLVLYPTFSGKTHPDKGFNRAYKIYEETVLSNKIDITQIEIYFKINSKNPNNLESLELIGYFFKYGEGQQFFDENTNRDVWRFFKALKSKEDNFISVANWDHLYEWRDDLVFDFDKLHELAPWIILRWNNLNLIPLTPEAKKKLRFGKRNITPLPKLKPWAGDLFKQEYHNEAEYNDLKVTQNAIKTILGDIILSKDSKLIKKNFNNFKVYFVKNA